MNKQQVSGFVHRFFEATQCQIIEKTPSSITVKLSPEADRALTGRSYYWDFIERTGATAETMSFTFVFDPEEIEKPAALPSKPQTEQQGDSILGRYFGFTPTSASTSAHGARKELVNFGSRRLDQLFQVAAERGQYVNLYEVPNQQTFQPYTSTAFTTWLGINYKVELVCDMKRDELHSLGISLATGEIVTQFHDKLEQLELTPRLPANTHTRQTISLHRAATQLHQYIHQIVSRYDHTWAQEAQLSLDYELERIDAYYTSLLANVTDDDEKTTIQEQYAQRKSELAWQYEPRIEVSAINCGLFHLWRDTFSSYDESR